MECFDNTQREGRLVGFTWFHKMLHQYWSFFWKALKPQQRRLKYLQGWSEEANWNFWRRFPIFTFPAKAGGLSAVDSGRSEGNICPRSHYLHQISSTNTTTNTTTNTNGNINTNKVSALNSKHLFLILSFKAKTLDNGESCLILLTNLKVQKYMKRPLIIMSRRSWWLMKK